MDGIPNIFRKKISLILQLNILLIEVHIQQYYYNHKDFRIYNSHNNMIFKNTHLLHEKELLILNSSPSIWYSLDYWLILINVTFKLDSKCVVDSMKINQKKSSIWSYLRYKYIIMLYWFSHRSCPLSRSGVYNRNSGFGV